MRLEKVAGLGISSVSLTPGDPESHLCAEVLGQLESQAPLSSSSPYEQVTTTLDLIVFLCEQT